MEWNGYELANYTNEDMEEILTLISPLLGSDRISNRDYFIWKHQKNPFLKKPLGIVARYAGRVVGFIGYVPAECRIGKTRFMILQQCDTVVYPEHRGKGLFSAMTKTGLRTYSDEYKFIVNFTSNHMTAPRMLKLGCYPLAARNYLRHFNLLSLARNRLFGTDGVAPDPVSLGDIEVTDSIHAADISGIGLADYYSENKISPNKTGDFLEWRLSNPRVKYTFFHHRAGGKIDAYLILRTNKIHAHVFDYGQREGSFGVQKILSFILNHTRFSSVSFVDAGTPDDLKSFLRKRHFYTFTQIERMRNRESNNIPIVIRPTVQNYSENDWFVDGVDARDINNWHITEICFD